MEQRLWPRITCSRRLSFSDFAASRIVPNESLSGDVGARAARDNLKLHITHKETFRQFSSAIRYLCGYTIAKVFFTKVLSTFLPVAVVASLARESLAFEGELSALRG